MSLRKCPKCGEMYSVTYKTCPFCTEDEAFYGGQKGKKDRRRVENHKSPSIVGPALVVVILLLVGFLVYAFLGGRIAELFQGDNKPATEQTEPQDEAETAPQPLTLDSSEMTLTAGESKKITSSGPEAVQWTSSDESVVKVAQDGTVTAVKSGSATVTAVAGDESVACTVTVKAKEEPKKTDSKTDSKTETKTETKTDSKTGKKTDKKLAIGAAWNGKALPMEGGKYDTTLTGKDPVQLIVIGTDSQVTWKSGDSGKVKISSDGTMQRVAKGTVEVTATVDGQTLTCLVRD